MVKIDTDNFSFSALFLDHTLKCTFITEWRISRSPVGLCSHPGALLYPGVPVTRPKGWHNVWLSCACYRLKNEVPTKNEWRKKPEQGAENQFFLVCASWIFSCLMTVLMKCYSLGISKYQSLFTGILTNIISDAVSLLESGEFFLSVGFSSWKLVSVIDYRKANVVWVQFSCWVPAHWGHFSLLFQESGIFILSYHIHRSKWNLWSNLPLEGHHCMLKQGWVTLNQWFAKGLRPGSAVNLSWVERICAVISTDCTVLLWEGLGGYRAEVCSPGNPDTDSMSLRVFLMSETCYILFSDGCLEGRNKKEVSDLKASIIIHSAWLEEGRCSKFLVNSKDFIHICIVKSKAFMWSGLFGLDKNRWSGRQSAKWEWCISESLVLERRQTLDMGQCGTRVGTRKITVLMYRSSALCYRALWPGRILSCFWTN